MRQPILSDENFNKLPQLDRIEYRQREDRLGRKFNSSFTAIVMLTAYAWFIIGILLTGLTWTLFHPVELIVMMLSLMVTILKIFVVVLLITMLFDLWMINKKKKVIGELQKEYLAKIIGVHKQPIMLQKGYLSDKPISELKKKAGRPKKQN